MDRYVREVLVPRLNLIADIITQHGAYIEYPPMDYFKERFSGEASWGFYGPTIFMSKWLAYTSDWRPVLAEWERGEYVLPRISLPTFSTHELKSAGAQVRHGQADGDDAVRRAVPDDHLVERAGGEETHGADRYEHGV